MNKVTVGPMRDGVNSPRQAPLLLAATTRAGSGDTSRRPDRRPELFVADGYVATTVAAIAARARVPVDTVYATVGRKPALLRELVETAISGTDTPIPGAQRDFVARMRASGNAREALPSTPPPSAASNSDSHRYSWPCETPPPPTRHAPRCGPRSPQRRARNMRALVADLRLTGELRDDLTDDQIADIIWTMNSAEYSGSCSSGSDPGPQQNSKPPSPTPGPDCC